MKKTTLRGLFSVLAIAMAACSSADDDGAAGAGAGAGPSFHGEMSPLQGLSYDTGLIPAASPAQVQLKASAAGTLTVDAAGENAGGKLAGKAASGRMALDVHVKLAGRLKVESTFKKYDGELPGLKDLDIAITGKTVFDPFLVGDGESALLTAEVPEIALPEIPLGSIPGKLKLTVVKGSVVTMGLHGGCAKVSSGRASYAGEVTPGGKLVLKGVIALELPVPLNKSVELPTMEIPIPGTALPLDLGSVDASGLADSAVGATCAGAPAGGAADGGAGTPGVDGGAPNGDPTTQTAKATVVMEGKALQVDGIDLLPAKGGDPADNELSIRVSGSGVAAGSDILVVGAKLSAACAGPPDAGTSPDAGAQMNQLRFRPTSGAQFVSSIPATCTLVIDELPLTVGSRFRGSFSGTLSSTNAMGSKSVQVTFDVLRTK